MSPLSISLWLLGFVYVSLFATAAVLILTGYVND